MDNFKEAQEFIKNAKQVVVSIKPTSNHVCELTLDIAGEENYRTAYRRYWSYL